MLSIFQSVKAAAGSLATSTVDACGSGVDTAKAILNDIASASADLEAIGYTVRDIEVTVGIPPGVTVFLSRTGEPTDEAFAAVLARRSGQTTAWLLIKLVQQADGWSSKLRLGSRRCREIAVDLGLRPAVRLLFGKESIVAAQAEAVVKGSAESPSRASGEAAAQGCPDIPYPG